MTRLRSEQILQEKQTRDPNTISTLALNHKALSDVSCLVDFKNLERLDLGFSNLSSLEGLTACINLKWLSVIQSKLQSLKGIEGLTKLTVLNAGKNKLRSMDEIRSLVSLRALILNDNEIVSICRLDQVKNLNTLVLSRNPLHKIGESLVKVKSITKLSLSKCHLQTIDSSLKSCIELKELRLAHNDIKTLPAELAHNIKLQNLDLGNNWITSWSDLKVLYSLVNLKNLNLQGNPIAEKDKLAKKVKKLMPNLQIFNARPIDKNINNEKGDRVDDSLHNVANEHEVVQEEEKRDHGRGNKNSNDYVNSHSKDGHLDNTINVDVEKKLGWEKKKTSDELSKDLDVEKKLRQKKQKTNDELSKEVSVHKEGSSTDRKDLKRKSKKVERDELNLIDDGETPFMELFAAESGEYLKHSSEMKTDEKAVYNSLVTFSAKREKKSWGMGPAALQLSPAVEVGMGGPSTWDDE